MFNEMIDEIKEETVKILIPCKSWKSPERERVAEETAASHPEMIHQSAKTRTSKKRWTKIGRNDLCPCGSGKSIKTAVEEKHKV